MGIPIKVLLLFIIIAANFVIGLFVLSRKPKSRVGRSFCLAVTGTSVWGLGLVFMVEKSQFAIYAQIAIYGWILLIGSLLYFALVFPSGGPVKKKTLVAFIPLLFVAVVTPLNLIIETALFLPGHQIKPINGPLFPFFAAVSSGYILASIFLLFRTYKRSVGRPRRQINYLFFGLVIFLFCATLFDVVLPGIGIYQLNFLGPISSIAFIGTTAYAILRHELLDIRIVIQRGLIYTILFVIIISTYITGIQILGYFLQELTNSGAIISAGTTMVLGIFFLRPLENYFQKITDHIFFKGNYNYAEALHSLSRITYTSLSEKDIIEGSRDILKRTFKTDEVDFILDPGAALALASSEQASGFEKLAWPLTFEDDAPLGVLRLGKKRSGDSYTKQDLQLVSTSALQIAISLGKAKLHARVQEYSTHLEDLVRERTTEIRRLQEEQKEAMITISHNLQTPLAIIRGELEMLEDQAEGSSKIRGVSKSLDRISGFIRQLLRIARLEHLIDTVEMLDIDLSALLAEQTDYFEVVAEDKGARIEAEIENGIHIHGNKRLLEELFTNLVANAITYRSPVREPHVRIKLWKEDSEARVTISDNGIGIAPDDITRIFERFYRTSRDEDAPTGTGLGLAITKEVVERHGGSISVKSALDKGTAFTLVFPLK